MPGMPSSDSVISVHHRVCDAGCSSLILLVLGLIAGATSVMPTSGSSDADASAISSARHADEVSALAPIRVTAAIKPLCEESTRAALDDKYVEQSAQDSGRACRHQFSSDCTRPSGPHHLAASQRRCSGAGCDERTRSTADLHAVVRVGTSAGRGNYRGSGAIPPVDQAAKEGPQRRPPARSRLARKSVLARSALGALERARSWVCRRLLAWPLRLRGLTGLVLVNRISGVTHAFGTHVTQAIPRFCCAVLALGGSRQARRAQEHDAPDGGALAADGAGVGAYRHRAIRVFAGAADITATRRRSVGDSALQDACHVESSSKHTCGRLCDFPFRY